MRNAQSRQDVPRSASNLLRSFTGADVRRPTRNVERDGDEPIFNIGTGLETSVVDLVRLLGEIVGHTLDVRHAPPRPGEQRRSALDPTRARKALGWEPSMGLKEGLKQTYDWFAAQK
jgi:UDP-glucose 4-epimerase